jgi:hypothetical protein
LADTAAAAGDNYKAVYDTNNNGRSYQSRIISELGGSGCALRHHGIGHGGQSTLCNSGALDTEQLAIALK